MFASPPRQLLYIAYKLEITFSDEIENTKVGTGTAFLLASGNRPILVTNRHVVDLDYTAPDARYKNFRISQLLIYGRSAEDERYVIHLDPKRPFAFPEARENDVACLIDIQGQAPSQSFQMHHHALVADLATRQEFAETLWPGDQVYFSGFPSVHDKLEQRPILRAGVIASDPKHNYSTTGRYEGDRVAYEAMSTPGASGSPVYATARGINGIHNHVRRDMIVGINTGHIKGETDTHSGMSYFIKSTAILEVLAKHGVPI